MCQLRVHHCVNNARIYCLLCFKPSKTEQFHITLITRTTQYQILLLHSQTASLLQYIPRIIFYQKLFIRNYIRNLRYFLSESLSCNYSFPSRPVMDTDSYGIFERCHDLWTHEEWLHFRKALLLTYCILPTNFIVFITISLHLSNHHRYK